MEELIAIVIVAERHHLPEGEKPLVPTQDPQAQQDQNITNPNKTEADPTHHRHHHQSPHARTLDQNIMRRAKPNIPGRESSHIRHQAHHLSPAKAIRGAHRQGRLRKRRKSK